ncbi:MAG: hypothetical protein C4293_14030 [Nitrospiraceae bacterium]
MFEELLLWLFVVFSGIAVGAGFYEMRITVPQWFSRSSESSIQVNSEAMRRIDAGRRFWVFVTTVPLTLLTLASLPVAWQSESPRHEWWLAAALITLAERIGTFSYFIPKGLRLMHAETRPPLTAEVMASQWMALNRVRAALALLGWLSALKALSLPS